MAKKETTGCTFKVKKQKTKGDCNSETTKIDDLTFDLKRVQADFENYQKRTENEFITRDERTRANIMLQSITVLDTINEAIKHEPKNEALPKVKEVLVKFLHDNGVQKMSNKIGDQFDHEEMECLTQGNEKAKADEEVLEILQKGYYINDKVLRFAKVKVNKLKEELLKWVK